MENNKISISLTTIIIIIVCIVALIVGIVCYVVFNKNNSKVDNPQIDTNLSTSSNQTNDSSNTNSTINSNTNLNVATNSDDNTNNNNNNDISNPSTSSNSSSISTKTSTKYNPLSVGEWGLASKYSSNQYVDIPVKVTNIVRGTTASQKLKDYCDSSSSIYKYEDPKNDMEWAVIEYSVDLTNVETYSTGKPIKVDSKIIGTGDNNSIKYNGSTYIVSTINMTNDYTNENIATGYFAVQLPIGCTEYLIVLGSYSNTQAFFAGQ